jgi:DNA modification methylase
VEAAILEGFAVIGIERDAEYLPLIDARIARNDPTLDLGDGGAA